MESLSLASEAFAGVLFVPKNTGRKEETKKAEGKAKGTKNKKREDNESGGVWLLPQGAALVGVQCCFGYDLKKRLCLFICLRVCLRVCLRGSFLEDCLFVYLFIRVCLFGKLV